MNQYSFLLKYIRRFRNLIIICLSSGILNAFLNSIGITLAIPIIIGILDPSILSGDKLPSVLNSLFKVFESVPGDLKNIVLAIAILGLIIFKNVTQVIKIISNSILIKSFNKAIKIDLFKIIFTVDISFFNQTKIGSLVTSLSEEAFRTASTIKILIDLFNISLNILFTFIILIFLSWQITLITLLFIIMLAYGNKIFVNRAKIIGKKQKQTSRQYGQNIIEKITAIYLVKSFAQEKNELNQICDLIETTEKLQLQAEYSRVFIKPIEEVFTVFIILVIVLVGKYFIWTDTEAIAVTLFTYLFVLFRSLPLITQINEQRTVLANNLSAVQVIKQFLNTKDKPFLSEGNKVFYGLEKGIFFENVSFTYPQSNKLALKNLTLFIPKNKVTALVGKSGSGKSTLGNLFARFYDPNSGKILLDDIDYRDFQIKTIREKMAIVSQETFLFNDTIRNNICYGQENVSEMELIDAVKNANAYDFILKLPEKFDTQIGDRGVLLSGGQKQRIAIARAILRNPQLLLLDEATSALDTISEGFIQQALDKLSENRTTLVIAHRLSTIKNADQIVVLDEGEIKGIGTHEQLLTSNSYYQKFFSEEF